MRAAGGKLLAIAAPVPAAGCAFNQTNMSSRERLSAAAGFTSTSAKDCAGSRLTLSGNVSDRVARRKATAEARGHQEIAGDHIGAGRKVGQLEPAHVARAHGDGP